MTDTTGIRKALIRGLGETTEVERSLIVYVMVEGFQVRVSITKLSPIVECTVLAHRGLIPKKTFKIKKESEIQALLPKIQKRLAEVVEAEKEYRGLPSYLKN